MLPSFSRQTFVYLVDRLVYLVVQLVYLVDRLVYLVVRLVYLVDRLVYLVVRLVYLVVRLVYLGVTREKEGELADVAFSLPCKKDRLWLT